jgi:glycosyltransferase involved in cell wall biosynthesis
MPSRLLRICVVGEAHQVHVRARSACLAELGHEVLIVTERTSGLPGLKEIAPPPSPDLPKLRVAGALIAHARVLREFRPDVVHVHFAYRIPAWIVGILEPHPLVVSLMGGDVFFEDRGQTSWRRRLLTRHLLETADWVTAKNDPMMEAARKIAPEVSRLSAVSWGVDRRMFRRQDSTRLRRELALPVAAPVVLSCRSLRRLYNIHLLVDAMQFVRQRRPDAVLLLLEASPDEEYRRELSHRVEALRLGSSVRFLPPVGPEAMAAYYSLATVVASVPSSDGLPQTLLEAQACGAPVLLSRLAAYADLVRDGEDALLVSTDAASIGAGLLRLVEDSSLRERVAGAGLKRAASWPSLSDQARIVEMEYYELLDALPRRRKASARARALWAYLTLGLEPRH